MALNTICLMRDRRSITVTTKEPLVAHQVPVAPAVVPVAQVLVVPVAQAQVVLVAQAQAVAVIKT